MGAGGQARLVAVQLHGRHLAVGGGGGGGGLGDPCGLGGADCMEGGPGG